MSKDEEWSYDVGEVSEEADAEQAGEESARPPEQGARTNETDEEGWRFSLDDLEEDDAADDEDGWLNLSETVEAGSPDLENVVFVLLGVAIGIFVALQLFL
ncbi:MAG: hypothetical protein ABEI98_11655 [Halorhabdus sp.]